MHMMKTIPELVREVEERAKAGGVSVDALCAKSGVSRAAWQRWKAGATEPSLTRWRRVEDALAYLIKQRKRAA